MESEARKINVRIGGMSYNLVSGESEQYTRQIATRADEMIRRVTMQSPQLSQQMTTILALVNAVDELSRQAAQLGLAEQQRESTELKNAELRVELAKVRELNWEMKKEILRLTGLVREQSHQPDGRMAPDAKHAASPAGSPIELPTGSPAGSPAAAILRDMPAHPTADASAMPVMTAVILPEQVAILPEQVAILPEQAAATLPEQAAATLPEKTNASLPAGPAASLMDVIVETHAALPAAHMDSHADSHKDSVADFHMDPAVALEDWSGAVALPIAKPARILPPLGVSRSQASRSKSAGAPLMNWLPNPWTDAGELEADPGSISSGSSPEIPANEPGPAAGVPAPAVADPSAAKSPRQLHEMRQTGLEEYLSHYGQGRSVVTDLTNVDEP